MAALDFSDLTGKKKVAIPPNRPEGFNPPPVQPPQETKNAQGFYSPKQIPKEENKTQPTSMGYPTQTTQTGDELMQLFPTPILICPYPVDYTRELEWIRNEECRKENKGGDAGNGIHYNRQSEDTFVLDRPELANIRAFVEAKLHEYVTKVFASTDKLVITQSWLNKSKKGESHHEHIHPNSMVSGVWYPQIHEQMPPIQFRSRGQRDVSLQTEKFNTFNSATFMLPMKRGELILFPSNLQHSVPANQSDEERISLSFNTWPKGNMGDIKSLTYLPLDRCI